MAMSYFIPFPATTANTAATFSGMIDILTSWPSKAPLQLRRWVVHTFDQAFRGGTCHHCCGVSGVVKEIKLGATILKDEYGVTIPNRHVVGEILHHLE
jgi:hypothetical protein